MRAPKQKGEKQNEMEEVNRVNRASLHLLAYNSNQKK